LSAPCVFCQIVRGEAPAEIVHEWDDAVALIPLNPAVPGHTLVIPRGHVADFGEEPSVSAGVMYRAAQFIHWRAPSEAYNLITSRGRAATQSVFHLHLHLVPRRTDDGLAPPWYSGKGNHRG